VDVTGGPAPVSPGRKCTAWPRARPPGAFAVQLLLAHDAGAEATVVDPDQRLVHELQHVAFGVGKAEEELLGVGVGRLVRDVLRALFVRLPAVALALRVGDQDLLLLLQQLFPEAFHLLLFH